MLVDTKHAHDIYHLTVSESLVAVLDDTDIGITSGEVQLASMNEVSQLQEELDDLDGELMYAENAVMNRYKEFHKFRP